MDKRTKYDIPTKIKLDELNPDDAHAIILGKIPSNSFILDVGCATGYLGRYLTEDQGCVVDGIEYDARSAEIAQKYYRRVLVGDVEDRNLLVNLNEKYDIIMCPAVLEHLRRPDLVLKNLRKSLKPDGKLIVNVPNVAHISLRINLLKGVWNYTDYGLLDRTHLRFYTMDTAIELIETSGYSIREFDCSHIGLGSLESFIGWLPRGRHRIRHWMVRHYPKVFGYELIFVAELKD